MKTIYKTGFTLPQTNLSWGKQWAILFTLLLFSFSLAQGQNIKLTPVVKATKGGSKYVGNFGLTYTVGQPVTRHLANGGRQLTQGFQQPEEPQPPATPIPQNACGDSVHTFIFTDLRAGLGADKIEWSLYSNFDSSHIISNGDTISITIGVDVIDTIWLRSRVSTSERVSQAVYTTVSVHNNIMPPTAPEAQGICSDTAYTFLFSDVTALGCGVQMIDVSTDSSFSTYTTLANYGSFEVSVGPDSSVTIWLRSRNASLDTVSASVSTTATVHSTLSSSSTITVSDTVVCMHDSISINISNSYSSLYYALTIDSILVEGALGNDTNLVLSYSPFAPTILKLIVIDSITGCSQELDSNISINVASALYLQPYFTSGSTLLCVGQEDCYSAFMDSSSIVYYSIISGNAAIDSLSGCVTNVQDSFVIRASVFNHCDTVYGDLLVRVVPLLLPNMPTPEYVCASGSKYFVLDSITTAGCGANSLQWSFDSTFASFQTDTSPLFISIPIDTTIDRILWVRSMDTVTNVVSESVSVDVPSYLRPFPPVAPASQILCNDTATEFFFDSILTVGCGGQIIEFSFDSTFASMTAHNSPADTSFWLSPPSSKVLWIRSRDTITDLVSDPVTAIAQLKTAPSSATGIASQTVCSDTAHTFSVVPIAGDGGNKIILAANSTFVDSQVVASGTELQFLVLPGKDTLLWFKSLDSISGLISKSAVMCKLSVRRYPQGVITPADTTVDEGDSLVLKVMTDSVCTFQWIGMNFSTDTALVVPYSDSVYYSVIMTTSSNCTSSTSSVARSNKTDDDDDAPAASYSDLNEENDIPHASLTDRAVGRIPGTLTVNNSGGSLYTIPIEVPPGTNNMVPNLSLVYNSHSGNGICGWGWNIAGLSEISRVGNNMYIDGKVAPVEFNDQDGFTLDGERLIATGSTADNGNGSGTAYATESESFSSIVAHDDGDIGNPTYWDVWTKDGLHLFFGHSSNSAVFNIEGTARLTWKLNRVVDNFGNDYSIEYINQPVGFVPVDQNVVDEINYTGNSTNGLSPYNKIKFSYISRLDQNKKFVSGTPLPDGLLVDKITVTGKDDVAFKTYQLNYGYNGVQSILNKIEETGTDGYSQLNSTLFKNGDIKDPSIVGYDFPASLESFSDDFNWNHQDITTGDYNGDGLTDFISINQEHDVTNPNAFVHLRKADNSGFDVRACFIVAGSTTGSGTVIRWDYGEAIYGHGISEFSQLDVDGDGREDIMNTSYTVIQQGPAYIFRSIDFKDVGGNNASSCYQPNIQDKPSSYRITKPTFTNWDYYMGINGKGIYTGDFNGDGRSDVITTLTYSGPGGTTEMYLSFPALGSHNNIIHHLPSGTTASSFKDGDDKIYAIDFDGDGKTDLARFSADGAHLYRFEYDDAIHQWTLIEVGSPSGYPTKWHIIYWGDFNGDGKADVLTKTDFNGATDIWEMAYSTGTGFTHAVPFPFTAGKPTGVINVPPVEKKLMIGDFNGDGKSDVFYGHRDSGPNTQLDVYYSTGVYFTCNTQFSGINLGYISMANADFNGDGRTDILSVAPTADNVEPHSYDILSFHKFGTEKQVEKICDGYNVVKKISYALLTSGAPFYDNEQNTGDYPVNNIRPGAFCVASTFIPNGSDETPAETRYSFSGARYHVAGRGFLGFHIIKATNLSTGVKEQTNWDLSTDYYIPLLSTKQKYYSGSLASNTIYSSLPIPIGLSDKRYWVYTYQTKYEDKYHFNKVINDQYDAYGNLVEQRIANGPEDITSSWIYGTLGAFGTPVPAKPISYVVEKVRDHGPAFNKTTNYDYSSTGALKIQTDFPGTAFEVSSSLEYDAFGNITSKTLSGYHLDDRVTTYSDFDDTKRFPTHITNPLLPAEEYDYDPLWGKIRSYKEIDGNTTSYEFDPFGHLSNIHSPHGFDVSTTYSWDVEGTQRYSALTHSSLNGRPDKLKWFDYYDRNIHSQTKGWDDEWIASDTLYDKWGNISSISKPYYGSETPFTSSYTYDNFNRLTEVSSPVSISTYSYTSPSWSTMPQPPQPYLTTSVSVTDGGGSNQHNSFTQTDQTGKVIRAHDNAGDLTFSYDSYGNQTKVKMGPRTLVTNEFDIYGNQSAIIDADAGRTEYTYDAFKQLTDQYDANGKHFKMEYDQLGRMTWKKCITCANLEKLDFEYVGSGSNGVNKLHSVTKSDWPAGTFHDFPTAITVKEYEYDNFSRVTSFTERPDGNTSLRTYYTYNDYDDVTSVVYSSGYGYSKNYDQNGFLTGIFDQGNSHRIYEVLGMNGFGQCTSYKLGNDKITTTDYEYGNPIHFYTEDLQNLYYEYEYPSANIKRRVDEAQLDEQYESFDHDNLDRMTASHFPFHSPSLTSSYAYDANGNITSKPDVGTFSYYSSNRMHGVKRVTNENNLIPVAEQDVTYNSFNQPSVISEGPYQASIGYSSDQQRNKMVLRYNQSTSPFLTRYYSGRFEQQDISLLGQHLKDNVHYINGIGGLAAIVVRRNGSDTYYYTYRDNVGSIVNVTDATGTSVIQRNFDAWGRPRNPADWSQYISWGFDNAHPWFYRGFTGHEELPWFNIVNMNGRLYDPVVGRILSPDNVVQLPYHTQSYNRYSYCLNNPLKYSDPTGQDWFHNNGAEIPTIWNSSTDPEITINGLTYQNKGDLYKFEYDGVTYVYRQDKLILTFTGPAPDFEGAFDATADFVGQADSYYDLLLKGTGPNKPPKLAETFGKGLQGLDIILGSIQVYKQYSKGGVKNVDPMAATGLGLNITAAGSEFLQWLGYRGAAVVGVGEAASGIGTTITVGTLVWQEWSMFYKTFDQLRYAPSYIDQNNEPVYMETDYNQTNEW